MIDVDEIALGAARRIYSINVGRAIGGKPQYVAMIQCAVRDAIQEYQQAARAQGGGLEGWNDVVQRAVDALSIMDESEGIAGWHLNGAVSPWDEGDLPAIRDELQALLSTTPSADKLEGEWVKLSEDQPREVDVDVKLRDGSVVCGCLAQSDGDFYWKGGGSEMFILEYEVVEWRAA
ncbi:hypothetical protein [uncultured Marinobacter sp.]|uniref:hypothetical protein n=1 Tax=uncultured Marinobacter sp. TaxID=187379 RepID=UPI00258BC48B|nr:hypothetical protein [uncultured Marinobacter sp.]